MIMESDVSLSTALERISQLTSSLGGRLESLQGVMGKIEVPGGNDALSIELQVLDYATQTAFALAGVIGRVAKCPAVIERHMALSLAPILDCITLDDIATFLREGDTVRREEASVEPEIF
ncbi:hypothetical protein J2D73_13480 [Acetobacter sacchari]|uniref:Uncharacterized protein n=1 Tax=Acetobacter sacchari TaxID=2661687 RepID=A0ABS3LY08_9PROT|nr:hypothetical protein [Acetobacter sacchari]MBO1360799.1 hypothetical protein [Acetobacter sacchari]